MSVKQYENPNIGTVIRPKQDKDISIIIINYNLSDEIENCLNSLLDVIKPGRSIDYEVIVVDNNSPDRKIEETEKKFGSDEIHFYYLHENLGFGKGCNFGFSKASGEYICFLNPDTIIKDDIFLPIIKIFEGDSTIGIIGPKQETRGSFFDFSAGYSPNIFFELFNLLGLGVFFEGLTINMITRLKKNEKINVNWILGAAIFIKAELFRKVGGFDKDYFMFFEELDLCKRVKSQGMKIIYCPEYRIHHIGSVSGKKDYFLYTIRTYASKNIYISKHYKSLKKILMKIILSIQLVTQSFIWLLLFPVNKSKSIQKFKAFWYLLENRLMNKIDKNFTPTQ